MNTSVDIMAKLIAKNLEIYTEEVQEKMEEIINEVSIEALEATKNSPTIKHLKNYKSGFYIKNNYTGGRKRKGYYRLIIAQREYRIAHLVEKGHVTRNGGRTRKFPHFIEGQKVADTLPNRFKEVIENARR
jgi:hypothetical protein